MKPYERVYAVVNLDAIRQNIENLQRNLSPDTGIYGVIKADGYGHGAVPIARELEPFVKGFAVATIWEALNLRKHGIVLPILVMGYTYPSAYEDYISGDIRPTVYHYETAKCLSQMAVSMGSKVKIHLKLDTGMSRIGYPPTKESVEEILRISKLDGIEIEGIFTHFASADAEDKASAYHQLRIFMDFVDILKQRKLTIPVKHCSNSAALMEMKAANLDAVRAGIAIYGLYPSKEVKQNQVILTPALELKSEIIHIKALEKGIGISYGATFITDRKMVVATIPIGYGDGYPRSLSNKGYVLIHGQRADILGRVCMDQIMVDVTHIDHPAVGDVVTLIGKDGELSISVEELTELAGTFHYEFVCNIGKRIPRVYIKGGKIIGTKDYFRDAYV